MQRVAIVTGGATGIGRALSTGLAADGLAVVVGWYGNGAGAHETQEAIDYLQAAAQPQAATRGAAVRLRFDHVPDLGPHLGKLRIEGAVLDPQEILDLIRVLDISRGWAWGYAPGGQVGYVRAAAITG